MPPAESGDASPAASPTSTTRGVAKGATGPPTGIEPAAPAHAARAEEVEVRGELGLECRQVGPGRAPAREAHLRDAVQAGHHPADVAAREPSVEEAVQAIGIDARDALVLHFDAQQELGVAAEPELRGHRRMRTVGADEVAHALAAVDEFEPVAGIAYAAEGPAEAKMRAGATGLAREPAHERGRVGREEVIAGRLEVERGERGRMQADTAYAARSVAGISHRSAASFTSRPVVWMR